MKTCTHLLALLLAAAPAIAQENEPAEPPFVLPAGDLATTALIDACANYLGWNILYSEQELGEQGQKSKLQQQIVTDRDGCEELLYGLLYRQGFAVKTLDLERGVYEVLSMQGPRRKELGAGARFMEWSEVLQRPALKRQVLTTVPLQHIDAQLANNTLRPFFAGSGGGVSVGTVGDGQSLLLQGFQDQVAQAVRVVQLADVPQRAGRDALDARTLTDRVEALEARIRALEEKLTALQKRGS